MPALSKRAAPSRRVAEHLLAAEVTGVAASVKVEEIYPKERYVNYLSLLKISGEWKIVNKIFDVKSLDAPPVVPAKP